ncbi:MAG: phosphopentomutase, partial [Clostridia bacterium]|nr:phosphopentomutase [Clostridia bacterium]
MSFNKKIKRIFIIVLDSLGAGALPDADRFGDKGAFTLSSIYKTGELNIPNLVSLGIGNIQGLDFLGTTSAPKAAYGRMAELSNGKDTTIGHWEIAGIVSKEPFPTYKDGFPKEILDEFTRLTGKKVLCNKPYSGT